MKSKLLGALCFAVLCITLYLGLSPFHSPRNSVAWLNGANGVAFGRYGTILCRGSLSTAGSHRDAGGSIEMWVQPDRWTRSTLMALYRPEKSLLFTLGQSLTDLEVRAEEVDDSKQRIKGHFYVRGALGAALRQKKPVFLTVTSGPRETIVYLDGFPVTGAPGFRIPDGAITGRLIVGDTPWQPNSFRGQIRGVAIYDLELSGTQVFRHYRTWTDNGRPDIDRSERNLALYLFEEHHGNVIRNYAAPSGNLYIPDRYSVVDKISLEPFWTEFDFSRSYWSGNLKNIVGFIPAGFCFLAYFTIARPVKRAVLLTIILGALVSLTIEIGQAFLPTRDSGTTDIVTNTFGTYIGVLCYRYVYPIVVERFPQLGWLTASPEVSEALSESS